jgi:hypothetical protein
MVGGGTSDASGQIPQARIAGGNAANNHIRRAECEYKIVKGESHQTRFYRLLQGKFKFRRLGTKKCNDAALQVYFYFWEETPPGRAWCPSLNFSPRTPNVSVHHGRKWI